MDNESSSEKKPKIHQCDKCGKAYHRREYLTRHMRTHTGSFSFKRLRSMLYKSTNFEN